MCRHSRDYVQRVADGTGCAGVTAGTHARPLAVLRHRASTRRTLLLATCRIRTRPFVEGVGASRTGRPAEETEPEMSTTRQIPTRATPSAPPPAAERQPVWKHGVTSAVVASVATTVLAAIASAAGVSFADSTGASIPIAGFAQLTLVFSLVGVGIAAVMARKARRPRASSCGRRSP